MRRPSWLRSHSTKPLRAGSARERRRLRRLARRAAAQPTLLADPRDLERDFIDQRAERLAL